MTYKQAINWLDQRTSKTKKKVLKGKAGFDEAVELMKHFGDPQNEVPAIHVAATMGKGTVCQLITNILAEHEFNVVTILSPHTYSPTERIEYNGIPISEEKFAALVEQVKKSAPKEISYFNAVMLMGFLFARDQKVDYVVVETGLGGLRDSSNTIARDDKVSVLGRIGFDHQHILGDTLPEIAKQKAGIILPNSTVLALAQDESVTKVFRSEAAKEDAQIDFVNGHNQKFDLKKLNYRLSGEFQKDNFDLVLATCDYLASRDNWKLKKKLIIAAIRFFSLPGRAEVIEFGKKVFIFDTAHNLAELKALKQTLNEIYNVGFMPGLIMASSNPEQAQKCLDYLSKWTEPIITTKYLEPTLDMFKPAVDLAELTTTNKKVIHTQNANEAVDIISEFPDQKYWLVTGSTYHLTELKQALNI